MCVLVVVCTGVCFVVVCLACFICQLYQLITLSTYLPIYIYLPTYIDYYAQLYRNGVMISDYI